MLSSPHMMLKVSWTLPFCVNLMKHFCTPMIRAIIATGDTETEITTKLNNALMSASTWSDENKLSLNIAKTKCLYLDTSAKVSRAQFQQLECKGETVGEVDNFKYLSLILDNTPKFDKHTSYIKRKVFIK